MMGQWGVAFELALFDLVVAAESLVVFKVRLLSCRLVLIISLWLGLVLLKFSALELISFSLFSPSLSLSVSLFVSVCV